MSEPVVRGSSAIAKALGDRSPKTIQRMFARGQLPGARKLGDATSPIEITRKALADLKRGAKGGRED